MELPSEKLTLPDLPYEIQLLVISFLTHKDGAYLKQVSQFYYHLFKNIDSKASFLSAINSEIMALGYALPNYHQAFIGIQSADDQCRFLHLLKRHRGIRQAFDIFSKSERTDSYIVALRNKINIYQKDIEDFLQIPDTPANGNNNSIVDQDKLAFLESSLLSCNEGSAVKAPIYNRILVRLYAEALRLTALVSGPEQITSLFYKKLFVASQLLLKLGDNTAYFCMVDIANKCYQQSKGKLIDYIFANLKPWEENANHSDKEIQEFLFTIMEEAFLVNGIDLTEMKDNKTAFTQMFNYTIAFFYPKTTVNILSYLLSKYKNDGFTYYANIHIGLFKCLAIAYKDTFAKIFNDSAQSNIELTKYYFEKNKDQSVDKLLAFSKHKELFKQLTLEEIFNTPDSLIPILKKTTVWDLQNWNKEYVSFLDSQVEKLKHVPLILKYWSAEDIKQFLENSNKEYFSIIANCQHQQLLFRKLKYTDTILLHTQSHPEEKNLLELFCKKDNLLIVKALLEKPKNIQILTEIIEKNLVFKRLLKTKNANLILEKFPKFFHQLRIGNFVFDRSLSSLLEFSHNKDFFLFILKLCKGEYFFLQKNIELIKLLNNKIVYKYFEKYNLSFDCLQKNLQLFKMLKKAEIHRHIYLLSVEYKDLNSLYQANCLYDLLSINSETLLAWVLFGIVPKLQSYEKYAKELKLRPIKDITQLLKSTLISTLDKFGFSLKLEGRELRHCDEELTRVFSITQLFKFDSIDCNGQSLLKYICSLNPVIILEAISYARENKSEIDIAKFISFFSNPVLNKLNGSFGWMFFLYFDQKFIQHLNNLWLGDANLLSICAAEENKNIFFLMIKNCQKNELLEEKRLIKAQIPPSEYRVDSIVFNNLLVALISSKFIFQPLECCALLNKFTPQEIIFLNHTVYDEVQGFTYLDSLAHVARLNRGEKFEIILTKFSSIENCAAALQKYIALEENLNLKVKKYQLTTSRTVSLMENKGLKRAGSRDIFAQPNKHLKKNEDFEQAEESRAFSFGP